jgi:hypothetical protein
MDSLSTLVKECLKNGMGFMIESFEYSTNNKSANLYQNSFRYYPDIEKVNCSVKSYFDITTNDELKNIDDNKLLEEAYKDISEAYLKGEISQEDHDALIKIIKDKDKIKAVYLKKSKILTPEIRKRLVKGPDEEYNKVYNNIYEEMIPTNNPPRRKYLYL